MLVHYFLLLEFKFIFEFIWLNPFQKNVKTFSFSLPLSFPFLHGSSAEVRWRSPDLPYQLIPHPSVFSPSGHSAQRGPHPTSCSRWPVGAACYPHLEPEPNPDSESDSGFHARAAISLGPHAQGVPLAYKASAATRPGVPPNLNALELCSATVKP
jgi:hypothetical protein